jgi:uncharacterized protein
MLMQIILVAFILVACFVARGAAAQIDDAEAAFNQSDFPAALQLLRPLAEQGDPRAQVSLGQMYDFGYGVPQDYAETLKWYRKAADQGYYVGQYLLGFMYKVGRSVPQDYVAAHMWWNLAAAAGDQYSAKHRDEVAALMTPEQIGEAQKLAREWKPRQ